MYEGKVLLPIPIKTVDKLCKETVPGAGSFRKDIDLLVLIKIKELLEFLVERDTQNKRQLGGRIKLPRFD